MRKMFRKIVAVALCIAMVSALLPAQQLGLEMAVARAESAPAVTPDVYADVLALAGELLEGGGERSSGDWRYVLIEEKNIAVVTGYDGAAAEELTIPELLGGADVAGIAADALSGLKGVRRVGVPTNVIAIGKGALPAGSAVKANNGVYAAKWARKNGHAFTSTSEFDFVADVVDLTGTRPENFNRVSAEEIWLRELEASQISVGTKFFLADPDNKYQISYYEATGLTAMAGGFVAVSCVTPEVDSILYYYEATDQEMMVDYSTIRLAEGAEIDPETEKSLSGELNSEWGVKIKPKVDLGGGWELKANIGLTSSWNGSYEIGLFTENSLKIEQTDKLSGSVTVENSADRYADENKELKDKIKERLEDLRAGEEESFEPIDVPMGTAVVFSLWGFLNCAASLKATFEISGKVSISFSHTTTTTYDYSSGELEKSTEKGVNSFSGSAEGTLKVGTTVSLEAYITAIKVFTVSLFVGLQADVKYDFGQLLNYFGNWISTGFTGEAVFKEQFNPNMLDCMQIDIYILVEVSASIGVGKLVELASVKVTLAKWQLCTMHAHFLPAEFIMETKEDGLYICKAVGTKDAADFVHYAVFCPYDVKNANFYLDAGDGDKVIRSYPNLPIGSKIEEPEIDAVKDYGVKLIGWHTDKSMDDASLVTEWPYEIEDSVNFYADTRIMRRVNFVDAAGTALGAEATIKDDEEEWTYKERDGMLAMGEKLVLPDEDSTGEEIKAWIPVVSDEDLTPIGDELLPGEEFEFQGYSDAEIYLCALSEKTIVARFYTGAGSEFQTVYGLRGEEITVPECKDSIPCHEFTGWVDSEGEILMPGDKIATDYYTPAVLLYTAQWEHTGEVTAADLANISIGGSMPSFGTLVENEEMFDWYEVDGGVRITGFKNTEELVPINVAVPATIDGMDVVSIAGYAFDNVETLRAISFPSTVEEVGSHMLQGCKSLVYVNLAMTQITEIPEYFADGCTALQLAVLPVGKVDTVNQYAFRNCTSITRANINYDLGTEVFSGCTALSSVTIGRGCTELGYAAFANCTALTDLVIPDSVVSAGQSVIRGCTALKTLEIHGGMTRIRDSIFNIGEVNSLQKLTVGFGVTEIDSYALDNDGYGFPYLTEIVLPASLAYIGPFAFNGAGVETLTVGFANGADTTRAFRGLAKLKTLNLTSGAIGDYCFEGVESLETVNIGEAVTYLGQGAFQYCTGLTNVNIDNAALDIGNYAFNGCTALTNINLGENALSIGTRAFQNCASLTALYIPDSVTDLGQYIIDGCFALKELSVGKVLNGLGHDSDVLNIQENTETGEVDCLTTLTLREGVTTIPGYTFNNEQEGFKSLKTLILPTTLRTIGEGAFNYCGIEKLVINSNVTLSMYAFRGCDKLAELEINAGIIGNRAFQNTTSLKKVTLNTSSIGAYAFEGCTSLTDVTIGEGVRTICEAAFLNCTALNNLQIEYGVRTIEDWAFEGCSSLTYAAFPDSVTDYGYTILWGCTGLKHLVVGGGMEVIGENNFDIGEGATLETVVIGEGVTTLNSGAFSNNAFGFPNLYSATFPASMQTVNQAFAGSSLASVRFEGDVTLGGSAFYGISNLRSVYMPSGVIGSKAFQNCTSLTDVYLGDNVTSMDTYAFSGCTALSNIHLGSNLTTIGARAFEKCTSLKSLTIPDSVTSMPNTALYLCSGLEYLSIGAVVDSMGVIDFGENAQLRTLEIREGATKIKQEVFDNNDKYLKNLETVSLPATLATIDKYAFAYSGVQRVVIKGETAIGSYAFQNCSRLQEVSVAGGSVGSNAFLNCVSLKKAEVLSGAIYSNAFSNCVSLESLHLGDGVTQIGDKALNNCRSLKSLTIPDSVTTLGNKIILGCTGLETLIIGGISCGIGPNINNNLYGNNIPFCVGEPSNLKTLIIHEGVPFIGDVAFANYDRNVARLAQAHGFDKLETVVIPESVTFIGSYAFAKSGLRSVTVKGAPTIDNQAFADLQYLEEAFIAGGTLKWSAFENCVNLETVVLEEGVTAIEQSCFENCSSLKSLYIPDSVTTYGTGMISGCTAMTSLSLGGGVTAVNYELIDVGLNSSLKVLEVREGVKSMDVVSYRDNINYNLEIVTLPSTMTSLSAVALAKWPNLKHLYLRNGSALPAYETPPEDLTIYTDAYSAKVDDYALMYGVDYIIRNEADFPRYTLNYVVPSGSVANAVMEESDGTLVVTEGTAGKTVTLPEGYALLDKQRVRFADEIVPEELTVADGYVFHGWYTDRDYRFKWNGTTMPSTGLTLYARIDPLVNVRFALTMGGISDASLPAGWLLYDSATADRGTALPLPEDPAIDGWNFQGWYMDEACTMACKLTATPDEDLTLYGKLERVTIGGEYKSVSGGLQLTKYTLEQDENDIVYIPARVNGVPVVSIAKGAFEYSGVKTVVIPSSVTEIEPGALNCTTMVSVIVSGANTSFVVENDVLYNADKTELVYYPYKKTVSTFAVPSTVKKIRGHAFRDNPTLTKVTFSGTNLVEIGESAFAGMKKLTRMDLPASTTTLRLNAFQGCTTMEYFYAYGLETIETVTGMDTLPYGTGMWVFGPVGEGVLRDYFSYTDSDGNVHTTQYNLFKLGLYVSSWEYMYVEAGQLLPDMLADVTLDNGAVVNEWHVGSATGELVDLAAYTMPEAATNLYAAYTPLFTGSNATVTDASGQSYSGYVYTAWNGSDGKAVIPEKYNNNTSRGIGEGFLANSKPFTEITIPASVVSIADGALDGFTGTVLCDPDSFAAQWADEHGVNWEPILYTLSFVTMGEEIAPMQAAKTTLIALSDAERAGFEFVGWYTNENCTDDVTLDEDGLYAMPGEDTTLYAGWDGVEEEVPFTWTAAGKQVTITGYTGTDAGVTIPETINSWPVTAIADSAFAGESVVWVDLGPVKVVGDKAFNGCEALRTVIMNAVTGIGGEAFAGCPLLQSPELPDTLVSIGNRAFEGCSGIGSIVLPDSVTTVGKDAFVSCEALKTVSVGAGVKSLDVEQFSGCGMLREITVSSASATYKSANGALYTKDGKKLVLYPMANTAASFTIEAGVTEIGERAFAGAKKLTSVAFPDSLKKIGSGAFEGCGIGNVKLAHVETIGDNAFFGCSALAEADLGDSIVEIGSLAFASCGSLTDVTIPATAQMDEDTTVFNRTAGLTITGVTGSSAQDYAKANGIAFDDPNAVAVEKVVISAETLTLNRGESATLTATVQPAAAVSGITWTAADTGVVMVNENGVLRAIGGGETVVSAIADNGVSASCTVTVKAPVEKIIPDVVKPLLIGETAKVGVSFVPATPTDAELTWSVEDENIATVKDGVITAVAHGSTNVIATAPNGVSAKIPVTVYIPVESIAIVGEANEMITVDGHNTQQLKVVVTPENATFKDCHWTSNDSDLVAVDENGLVTAKDVNGTAYATITATSMDPSGMTATYAITPVGAVLSEYATVEFIKAEMGEEYNYELEYVVRAGNEILGEGDYTATEPSISGAGEYTLTLKGYEYGRFTGTMEVPFTIAENSTEIVMDNRKFTWLKDLNPVLRTWPTGPAITVEYVLIGEDGSRTSVGDAPTVSGLYEIIARTERYVSYGFAYAAAEASTTMWIQMEKVNLLDVYDTIVMTKGQQGRIPVGMKNAYAPLQSGFSYTSSNKSVFTVDEYGVITAVGNGTATLKVAGLEDSSLTGSCKITVKDMNTLNLPAALSEIEAEAFAGTPAVQKISAGKKVASVGSRAFAGMSALEQVVFENDRVSISADAFDGSGSPLIVCKAGSAAARFAAAHGLKRLVY